jgi:hypothetical protein
MHGADIVLLRESAERPTRANEYRVIGLTPAEVLFLLDERDRLRAALSEIAEIGCEGVATKAQMALGMLP